LLLLNGMSGLPIGKRIGKSINIYKPLAKELKRENGNEKKLTLQCLEDASTVCLDDTVCSTSMSMTLSSMMAKHVVMHGNLMGPLSPEWHVTETKGRGTIYWCPKMFITQESRDWGWVGLCGLDSRCLVWNCIWAGTGGMEKTTFGLILQNPPKI